MDQHVAEKRPRGRPRKTVQDRDDGNRRQLLIAGAARLFRQKGFDATSTRDIAAAVGMQSGSPFYHFESKGALLYAVMEEGMRAAIAQQADALQKSEHLTQGPRGLLAILIRNHFDVLLGPGSDFIPVMLYESRAITAGQLRADVKLARLLIFGALNWSVQWYDRRKGATLDQLTQAAMALFIHDNAA